MDCIIRNAYAITDCILYNMDQLFRKYTLITRNYEIRSNIYIHYEMHNP